MALLTAAANNAKTAKDGKNILGAIQHLPPYTKSGANFCAFAHKANDKEAREFLEGGGNIAVVFAIKKGDPLPATFWGFPVHDADKSDWRFQDAPGGTVQGVRSKGKAKKTDSTKPCWMYCLDESGRGVFDNVQEARQRRAALFLNDRPAYKAMLVKEVRALERKAKREDKIPAVRLNGTSDLRWERIFPELFEMFPDVQFYDYTKVPGRVVPSNYHITFSLQFIRSGEAS
jgi:hypothetical protein